LDQQILSGIGNIYADESLWAAKIHPERICSDLSIKKINLLIDSAREIMARALESGGTSFDDLYINVNGESGYFEVQLEVYGCEGEPCSRCHRLIKRISFANRSSHFCPYCQK
jgi:formamidopyrimidine-DNA glycosylase